MSHLIIMSAPSGSDKSTVTRQLMQDGSLRLSLNIFTTSRPLRGNEQHDVGYYFYTPEQPKKLIAEDRLAEYMEVHLGKYYGTLRDEVDRLGAMGHNILFNIGAVGAMRIQETHRDKTISILPVSPTFAELRRRLRSRDTESPELVEERMRHAPYETSFAKQFDHTAVNDDLKLCASQVARIIHDTISK